MLVQSRHPWNCGDILFVYEVFSKLSHQDQCWSAEQALAVLKWSGVTGSSEQNSGLWRNDANQQMENPAWRLPEVRRHH